MDTLITALTVPLAVFCGWQWCAPVHLPDYSLLPGELVLSPTD